MAGSRARSGDITAPNRAEMLNRINLMFRQVYMHVYESQHERLKIHIKCGL
jgi:hypothetical protein